MHASVHTIGILDSEKVFFNFVLNQCLNRFLLFKKSFYTILKNQNKILF